jgi:hypothetical protein
MLFVISTLICINIETHYGKLWYERLTFNKTLELKDLNGWKI